MITIDSLPICFIFFKSVSHPAENMMRTTPILLKTDNPFSVYVLPNIGLSGIKDRSPTSKPVIRYAMT